MEEETPTANMIDYETPMKMDQEQHRRKGKIGDIVMVTFVAMIGVAVTVGMWRGSLREPVELTYCGIDNSKIRVQHSCTEFKLRIPFVYYSGYPLDYPRKVPRAIQRLEVAYPSMQPWNSLSMLEKWNTNKIEIEFSLVTGRSVKDLITISSLGSLTGTIKTSRVPGSIYGLDQYLDEPTPHVWQYLVAQAANPRIYLRCAYRTSNPDENSLGCSDFMFTEWGLEVEIIHQLILMRHWADMHDKVLNLIQSFVVIP